jgi:hypothetical protein
MKRALVLLCLSLVATACGSGARNDCTPENLMVDEDNCGVCGRTCEDEQSCVDGLCTDNACEPGMIEECYSGPEGTNLVGTCRGGMRTCTNGGTWGICVGEVTPQTDVCGNGIDENCSGVPDEDVDLDMDGYTTCDGDCCDSESVCAGPVLVNPGAFESNGNSVDDDCDGVADNALALCDEGLLSNSSDPLDYARAMDLCQTSSLTSRRWGVIDGELTLANGMTVPDVRGRAIRQGFGTAMPPQHGTSVVVISSGVAADVSDTNPNYTAGDVSHGTQISPFPADWLAANGGALPNAPGCPAASIGGTCGVGGCDPVMLTLNIRVPSNAKSFSMKINFMSREYPEYVCTQFNDMFVVLLDSTYAGDPPNPADKNLAFYTDPVTMARTPVGINLAHDNTGLYTMCVNGTGGCAGSPNGTFPITSCIDSTMLMGTGFDAVDGACGTPMQLTGGGTGWLTTSGNVVGGEIMKLRIAIWDTSDHVFDSTAIIDDFQWSVEAAEPGTVIE